MGVCCIVFDIDGMLLEFFMNFLNIDKKKLTDGQTDRQTDRQTDGRGGGGVAISPVPGLRRRGR